MVDATPTGPVSLTLAALQTLISNVAFFQTWTGSADAAAALNRVVLGEIGLRVSSIAVSSHVMTVMLQEPAELSVGQVVQLDGADAGEQGAELTGGGPIVALVTTAVHVPALDEYGNHCRDIDGNFCYEVSDEVLGFTLSTASADVAIFQPDGVNVLSVQRPFAVLTTDSSSAIRGESIATDGCNIQSGVIDVLLEGRVSQGYRNSEKNAVIEADNIIGQLIDGMMTISETGNYMTINRIELPVSPAFTHSSEQFAGSGRFEIWRALLRVYWGFES